MRIFWTLALVGILLALCASTALADDIEGRIESIQNQGRSFVVQGIGFFVTRVPTTMMD